MNKLAKIITREDKRSPKYTQTMYACTYRNKKITQWYATCLYAVEEAKEKGFVVKEFRI